MDKSQTSVVGWDIGGAHVKALVIGNDGRLQALFLEPCRLWQGLNQLQQVVSGILQKISHLSVAYHAITMTGELVDLFANRQDGVYQIAQTLQTLLPGERVFFAGHHGFVGDNQVQDYWQEIASANWLASAQWAAQIIPSGLLVDIGSTTTDIIPFKGGKVAAQGYSDYERLQTQELVYTGIVRTPVMAVSRIVEDQGKTSGLMAEYFATMADVYRVTAELCERHDRVDTADGTEKTVVASAKRLARMIGCDFVIEELPRWQRFAANIRSQQVEQIKTACEKLLAENRMDSNCQLIGAGIGRFLVQEIAGDLGLGYRDFAELALLPIEEIGAHLSLADCAPAMAVANLWQKNDVFFSN